MVRLFCVTLWMLSAAVSAPGGEKKPEDKELAALQGQWSLADKKKAANFTITFEVKGADGTLKIGKAIDAGLRPFEGATGKATALHDSIFTTIPGSPAYVGKASHYKVNAPGFSIQLEGHNAVSGQFLFEG